MDSDHILLKKDNHKATITISNPGKLNALTHDIMRDLSRVLKEISEDSRIRVTILTGEGDRAFVAGADIGKMEEMTTAQILNELPEMQNIVWQLECLPQPTIARVNGIALGGGTELALACDIRIASENAVFGLPEVKLGIIPGYGGTQRLPRLIGIAKAKELLFTGDQVKADEALRLGLVNQTVPYRQLDEAVDRYSDKLLGLPPLSLRFLKEAVNFGMQMDLSSAIRMESRLFANCFGSEDKAEGIRAFLEKRKAQFKGV
jgi:enoyl-CoA hydratase